MTVDRIRSAWIALLTVAALVLGSAVLGSCDDQDSGWHYPAGEK